MSHAGGHLKNPHTLSWSSLVRYVIAAIVIVVGLLAGLHNLSAQQGQNSQGQNSSESQIQTGFAIAPVALNLQGKNRALVGLGSYYVNAVVGCNDCHTSPAYKDNPFIGDPGVVNADNYLAGGRAFGPAISRNLTPDALGRPAGLTFSDFKNIIRTGIDDDAVPPLPPPGKPDLLQTMPWPALRNLTDNDLRAIYEYLSAIPCIATLAGANGEPPAHRCTP
jgi:hypothetical protein